MHKENAHYTAVSHENVKSSSPEQVNGKPEGSLFGVFEDSQRQKIDHHLNLQGEPGIDTIESFISEQNYTSNPKSKEAIKRFQQVLRNVETFLKSGQDPKNAAKDIATAYETLMDDIES